MVMAAIIGAALNVGLPARTKSLQVDGLDVLRQPITTGNGYGVPLESIQLSESGPGQVSSLSFTIEDPAGTVLIADGAYVRYLDLTRNLPLFAGFVESVSYRSFGVGRSLDVSCIGLECILDWMQVPAQTIPAGTYATEGAIRIISSAYGVGVPFRACYIATTNSFLANPMMDPALTTLTQAVIPAGTLRAALQAYAPAVIEPATAWLGGATSGIDWWTTVDFHHGIRWSIWQDFVGWQPSDYTANRTVSTGGPNLPSDLKYTIVSSGAARQVVINGGNAAGSGVFTDGTGKPGQIASISDPNSLAYVYAKAAASSYLTRNGITISGEATMDDAGNVGTAGAEYRAGVRSLLIAPAVTGLASVVIFVYRIDKTFTADDKERWTYQFGAQMDGTTMLRRLTRTVT